VAFSAGGDGGTLRTIRVACDYMTGILREVPMSGIEPTAADI
jgi:hypothetical protein